MIKILKLVDKYIIKVLQALVVFLIAAMVLLICLQVLFRYLLKIPAAWTEDLSRLAQVWCVFIASGLGVRYLEHPRAEILLKCLKPRFAAFLEVLMNLLIIFMGIILIRYGIKFVIATRMDYETSLRYPKNMFYIPAVVGGIMYVFYSAMHIIQVFKTKSPFINDSPKEV
ncbi:MAG TPA: TRAP transporter small permease [Clostridiaceae bacterium]|nr:TRAP transporter small permease [Clostridiaceae bacterium]